MITKFISEVDPDAQYVSLKDHRTVVRILTSEIYFLFMVIFFVFATWIFSAYTECKHTAQPLPCSRCQQVETEGKYGDK